MDPSSVSEWVRTRGLLPVPAWEKLTLFEVLCETKPYSNRLPEMRETTEGLFVLRRSEISKI